uniref:Uncharacterized protein n=1 Tax=Spironucleus salmonicida TaxID=348837 RepID=V6LAM5_9EUKA|eukprot:EST41510.1 Hypothetical protein SS50377_18834 [Spironucleus salmonicida]
MLVLSPHANEPSAYCRIASQITIVSTPTVSQITHAKSGLQIGSDEANYSRARFLFNLVNNFPTSQLATGDTVVNARMLVFASVGASLKVPHHEICSILLKGDPGVQFRILRHRAVVRRQLKKYISSPWIAEYEKARLLQQEETSAIGYLIWFRVPRQSPAFWIFTTYSALTISIRVVISAG